MVCLATKPVVAQEKTENELMLIHGVVFDAISRRTMSNVHYIVSDSTGGATNQEGKFSAYLYRGDTIKFSYVGYSDFYLSLGDTLTGRSYVAGVFMESDTVSAGEVIVIPRMGDLMSEFRNSQAKESQELMNARANLEIATYQGLTGAPKLGDPGTNYELIKQKQIITAYEKGGIPSDRMLGINFITLLPAAVYLMSKGLPEKPAPPDPYVSDREIERMIETYNTMMKKQRDGGN